MEGLGWCASEAGLRSVEARLFDVGSDNPWMAVFRSNMALLRSARGRGDEAQSLYEESLTTLERCGAVSLHTFDDYADFLDDRGHAPEARMIRTKATRIRVKAMEKPA